MLQICSRNASPGGGASSKAAFLADPVARWHCSCLSSAIFDTSHRTRHAREDAAKLDQLCKNGTGMHQQQDYASAAMQCFIHSGGGHPKAWPDMKILSIISRSFTQRICIVTCHKVQNEKLLIPQVLQLLGGKFMDLASRDVAADNLYESCVVFAQVADTSDE